MKITEKDWKNYIKLLSAVDKRAGDFMKRYVEKHCFDNLSAIEDYAYAIVQKYGEASGALSAEMYDAIAEIQDAKVPAAEIAELPTKDEISKTIRGVIKRSKNPNTVANSVSRLVKRTGADTTLNNAERDGAQFAWVPMGDTCAFCITLASRGWQYMSDEARRNGHAEHIHANCDCTYAVRFDKKSGVAGYDPSVYKEMYDSAEGKTSKDKINSMRRTAYAQNKDEINAQKRAAYALRNNSSNATMSPMRSKDVTNEYLSKANPGTGKVEIQKGLSESDHIHEIEIAKWIHMVFGGDVTVLSEDNIHLSPDYEWEGKLWDLKAPSKANKNTFEKRVKHGLKQISANPGGLIVDSSDMNFNNFEDAEKFIVNGVSKKAKNTTDCVIKWGDQYKVIRIIKEQ
jgi:hypothetical protein